MAFLFLLVNVFFFFKVARFEDGRYPPNEALVLLLKEIDRIIHLLMNQHNQLKLELMGQLRQEFTLIIAFQLVVVPNRARELFIEFRTHSILILDLIQGGDSGLKLRSLAVHILDDGREGAGCKGE